MAIYVGLPLLILAGGARRVFRNKRKATSAWMVMGFPLALHNAEQGPELTWIGTHFRIQPPAATATIPAARLAEVNARTESILKYNLITIKMLRTYAGKLQSNYQAHHIIDGVDGLRQNGLARKAGETILQNRLIVPRIARRPCKTQARGVYSATRSRRCL